MKTFYQKARSQVLSRGVIDRDLLWLLTLDLIAIAIAFGFALASIAAHK